MNNEWENFLLSNNANIIDGCVKDFAHTIAEEQSAYKNIVIADLSHYGLISARGDDVVEFLQGQLTNDIKDITDKIGQLSAYCNPKGRILANFRIFKRNEHYLLRLHKDILEPTLKRLRMFVMRSKVELEDSSDALIRIGIAGDNAAKYLTPYFINLPTKTDECYSENEITLIRLPGETPQYEAHGPIEKIKSLWIALQKEAVAIGENSWNLLIIRAGIPEIVSETVEAFVPQMVNLQAINSLSFTKGCYPGQEVVARMHYLGKLKRRLFIGIVKSDILPLPGQSVMSNLENEQKTGQIITASWSGTNKAEILAVLQIEKAENGELYIATDTQSKLQLKNLPYSLESK